MHTRSSSTENHRCVRRAGRLADPAIDIERDRRREIQRQLRRRRPLPDYLLPYTEAGRVARRRVARRHCPDFGNAMKNLRPVPWTSLRPGAVVDAWVPYDDGPGYKRRPAVVVEATKSGVILFPITTKVHRVAWRPGYVLALAREAGLRERRSAVLWRTVVVDRVEVLSLRGRLAGADHEEFLRQVGRC